MASSIGFAAAFMAGLISFLSPCVLPLVPGYVSYVAGRSVQELEVPADWRDRARGVGLSLVFVLGFSAVFVGIGASATALGQLILTHKQVLNLIGGAILMAFGLFMTGLLDIALLHRDFRFHPTVMVGRAPSAFLLGLAFAFGWTPCIGPVLGSIRWCATRPSPAVQRRFRVVEVASVLTIDGDEGNIAQVDAACCFTGSYLVGNCLDLALRSL